MQGARQVVRWAQRRPALAGGLTVALLIAWLFSASLFSSKVLGAQDILLLQTPYAEAGKPPELGRPSNPDLFDTFYQLQPDLLYARESLRGGHLPIWNPYIGAGEPQWATQQHSSLFPLNLPALIFPFWHALEWLAVLKLLAAGIGTLLFLRRLGLRGAPATLGAITYAFSSYLVGWLEHPLVNAWSVMPWLMWSADRLALRARAADAGLFAVFLGSALLGGNPQSALIAAVPVAPWFLYRLIAARRADGPDRPRASRAVGLFAAGGVLGAMLAAIVLVPFAEMAQHADSLSRNAGTLPKNVLFTFVAPEIWGRPDKFVIDGAPINYLERTAYFGAVPLVLAVAGLFARRTGPQLFFGAMFLMVVGYVVKVPLYTAIVENLPIISNANRDRFLVLCGFAGAVLAAYGLQHLLEIERRRLLITGAAVAAVLPLGWIVAHNDVLGSFSAALAQLPNIQRDPALDRPVLQLAAFLRWGLFAGTGLALIALAAARPRWRAALVVALIAVTAVDVVSYQRGFHPATPIAWADPPEPPLATQLRDLTQHERLAGAVEMAPNLAERFHIRDARKYESPVLRRRYKLWAQTGGTGSDFMYLPPEGDKAADLFAVRYQLSYALREMKPDRWKPVEPNPVMQNRHNLPRAFVAYDWRTAGDMDGALEQLMATDSSEAYRRPVIEDVPPATGSNAPSPTPARFETDGERGLRLRVDAKAPGFLVLVDTWYPGWEATVDGKRADIEHANVAFRGVRVPAGSHVVAFTYRPASVRIGEILTLLAAAAIAALLFLSPSGIRGYRSRRRESPATSAGDRPSPHPAA